MIGKKRKHKLSRLAKDKLNPYSRYWKRKAHEAFMARHRGKACAVCGKSGIGMVDPHHILTQGGYGLLANEDMNIIPLCKRHHRFDKDICAHGKSFDAQCRWVKFMEANYPDKVAWAMEAKRTYRDMNSKVDYKELYDKLTKEAV